MLADLCIYTIKHSDDLLATIANGGSDTYTEGKTWTRGKELLFEATKAGKRLPVVFAPAEGTFNLFAWATLDEIVPGKTTSYSFSGLQKLEPAPLKSTLKKAKDGEPLDKWFIRPYAICRTPKYLLSAVITSALPGELDGIPGLLEGALRRVTVNAYERNPEARRRCIAHYGTACCICKFDFGTVYGEIAKGFIHVHHLRSLSEIGVEYEIDPVRDLRPVCPNCHAVLHLGGKSRSIKEVRLFLKR